MESRISNRKECFICGRPYDLERHHCLHGSGRRKLAEEDGLWVWLCRECHNEIHFGHKIDAFGNNGAAMDLFLKKVAQGIYLKDHSIDEFIRRYGKNYI